jgi:hypothetical protein
MPLISFPTSEMMRPNNKMTRSQIIFMRDNYPTEVGEYKKVLDKKGIKTGLDIPRLEQDIPDKKSGCIWMKSHSG